MKISSRKKVVTLDATRHLRKLDDGLLSSDQCSLSSWFHLKVRLTGIADDDVLEEECVGHDVNFL